MDDLSWQNREPWVVVDPDLKREWAFPQPMEYNVVQDRTTGMWFVCDRFADVAVPTTEAKSRPEAIRRFYKWCGREMPDGATIVRAPAGVAHYGETG
jgi:hypothetical protein